MKIAWVTPFSRASAIGHYSAIVLDELARSHEVVVYCSDLKGPSGAWRPNLPLRFLPGRPVGDVTAALEDADVTVYNLGNNLAYHRDLYPVQLAHPGIVILHDLALYDFFNHLFLLDRHSEADFVDQLGFSHGEAGRLLARQVLVQRDRYQEFRPDPLAFTMARSAIHRATGVIVHGAFQRDALSGVAAMPVAAIDFPTPDLPPPPPARSRGDRVRLVTFGAVNPVKQIHTVIEALGTSDLLRRTAEYVVVGECPLPHYAAELAELARKYAVADFVHLTGRLPDAALYDALHTSDVVVNLRNPHAGEGSWSLLESLFAGKPTVVWPHGYYDEFPEGVVCKAGSAQRVRSVLEQLCADATLRDRIGRDARRYAERRFDTRLYCERFLAFAETCASVRPGLLFVDAISDRLRELTGPDPTSPVVERVCRELSDLLGAA